MLDITLLRVLKYRQDFYRVKGKIPEGALNAQTGAILNDYGKFFDKFPDAQVIDFDVFYTLFRSWHASLKDDKLAMFEGIINNARKDVSEDTRAEVMRSLLDLKLATKLANLAMEFEEGNLPNLFGAVRDSINEYKKQAGVSQVEYIKDDIDDLLSETEVSGIQWRLSCLNESMRPMQFGDFGIIAGRPDRGKTTFISSEVTYMAAQLPEHMNVVWLNNEGLGKRIIPRLYQSAIGATRSQLIELSKRGVIKPAYKKFVGRMDRIRVIDIHGLDNYAVEQLIEENNAGVVVYDMIDNVRGFGDSARTDLGLERMYQWGRELAVKLGHIGMATSQISADGEGLQFPNMSMLKDSKTGKQGACDFQIMIGSVNDPGYQNVRYIGVPKNKLRRDGGPADPRATVKYEPMRARYEDLEAPLHQGTEDEIEGVRAFLARRKKETEE